MKQEMHKNSDKRKKTLLSRHRFLGVSIMFLLVILLSYPLESVSSQPNSNLTETSDVVFNIYNVTKTNVVGNMSNRSLAFKSTGEACIVYGYDRLIYRCYDTNSNLIEDIVVDYGPRVGEYASLTFNNQNDPYIAYFDVSKGILKLAYKVNNSWKSPFEIAPQNPPTGFGFEEKDVGRYNSIDVDDNGVVHISYYYHVILKDNTSGELIEEKKLKYARWDGETLERVVVNEYLDQGATGWWTSIIADNSFKVHISYRDEKYNNLRYAQRKANGDWIHENVDVNTDVGSFTSIALDTSNTPYISYFDVANGNLKIAKRKIVDNVPDWEKLKVDKDGTVGWYTSMAIDSDNKIHISYHSPSAGTLKYALLTSSLDVSEIKTIVSKASVNLGLFTSIALGTDKLPGVVYYNLTEGILSYIKKTSSGWTTSFNIASDSRDYGPATSLALNSSGVPYISYLDESLGNLMMARSLGVDYWDNTRLLSTPHAGLFSSIKLHNDSPRIAFYDSDEHDLMYADYSTGSWVFSDVDTYNDRGQYVSLALAINGNPHISYYDVTEGDLIYRTYNSGWATVQKPDKVGDVGLYTSIVLDDDNSPHISYYDATNTALKYVHMTSIGAWAVPEVVEGGTSQNPDTIDVGKYSSIALDSSGNPHISYYDATNGNLKYASKNGSTWVTSTIDESTNDVGMYSSLAINTNNDIPHISYLDATDKDLKYVTWDGGIENNWNPGTIYDNGDVGYYSSIALNSSGEPAISFYDNTYGNLMIAMGYDFPSILLDNPCFIPMIIKR
jgi:hypothetical protein